MRPKRDKSLCVECNEYLATVFLRPNGSPMAKDSGGYCVDCHEREVRSTEATGRNNNFDAMCRDQVLAVF